ncbi:hypothetical protein [Methylomicrobium sp. Wu6]|uniref:hypothetical protein n=1 Tax=Methylomicrobium sp. Wu6 TaxID=3107928 RepID=UPI002DD68E4E|nr:hypothetical protein [Methylomicrobium sp. Wu6]MEC4747148.1 hypothetical protein [Methylomicrobium sp. Wu6]
MIRATEDLVEWLIVKNVFTVTDLPEVLQRKPGFGRQFREDLGMPANLIGKSETVF